jgi:hypothetical protein
LRAVAAALAQAGREDEASGTRTEALGIAKSIEHTDRQTDALGAVTAALAQARRFWDTFFASRPRDLYSYLVLRFRISVLVLGLDLRLQWEAC